MEYVSPKKLPNEFEAPFDIVLGKLADALSETIHASGLTPNWLTTISTVFGIMAIFFLHQKSLKLFGYTYLMFYLFDVLDGYQARKYNQCSRFGDYYDHITDWIIMAIVSLMVCVRFYRAERYGWIAVILIVFVLTGVHVSCQEQYTNEFVIPDGHPCKSHSLGIFNFCPGTHEWMKYTRYIGTSAYAIVSIVAGMMA